jgi:hypothetical protein
MSELALAGLPLDDEAFCLAAFGYVFRSPNHFQQCFFPNPDPRATRSTADGYLYNPDNHLHVPWSQYPLLYWHVGLFKCGRGVGKTQMLRTRSIQHANLRAMHTLNIVRHGEDDLKAQVFQKIINLLRTHPIFSCLLEQNKQTGGYHIGEDYVQFKNGSEIHCTTFGMTNTITGRARGQQGFRSHELDFDEAQNDTQAQLDEAIEQQQLNPFDAHNVIEQGVGRRLWGVCDGLRSTPFWHYDQNESSFHRFQRIDGTRLEIDWRWSLPKYAMPWVGLSECKEDFDRYHCDPATGFYTDGWKQQVAARHGRPAERLYPQDLRESCSRTLPDYKHLRLPYALFLDPRYRKVDDHGNLKEIRWDWLDSELPPRRAHCDYIFGMDVGTSADKSMGVSAICLATYAESKLTLQLVLELESWRNTEDQVQLVNYLCQRYNVAAMSVDLGGQGPGIVNPLTSRDWAGFPYKQVMMGEKGPTGYHESDKITFELVVDEVAYNLARTRYDRERLQANPARSQQVFKGWSMHEIHYALQDGRLVLPDLLQAGAAGGLHAALDVVALSRTALPSGGFRESFTPPHNHLVSALQQLMAAERCWKLRGQQSVRPTTRVKGLGGGLSRRLGGALRM